MPPRASLTSSFSVTDVNNEVVCPLRNQDGSSCRKRCLGEKRFRSMQEHIRRAHPEYYIPKLPATRDSFELMINSPPHERPAQDPNHANHHHGHHHSHSHSQHSNHAIQHVPQLQHQHSDPTAGLSPAFNLIEPQMGLNSYQGTFTGIPLDQHDGGYYTAGDAEAAAIYNSMQAQQRSSDEYRRGSIIPAASAAAALASLQYHRPNSSAGGEWAGMGGGDMQVITTFPSIQMSPTNTEADFLQTFYNDPNHDFKGLPHQVMAQNQFHVDPALEDAGFGMPDHGVGLADHGFPVSTGIDQPGLLPSVLAPHSPPDRPSTSAAVVGGLGRSISRSQNRPRKSSLQNARLAKHERKRSRNMVKRSSGGDRKAFSVEPGGSGMSAAALYGKRWEDLIDAATSATEEEGSRDLTPIPASPYASPLPHLPEGVSNRTSFPPFALAGGSQFQSFQASPLNRALTPPQPDTSLADLQTFPSVDSSLSSISHHGGHAHHDSQDSTGSQFQIMNPGSLDSSNTSPLFSTTSNSAPGTATGGAGGPLGPGGSETVQIYCSGCKTLVVLTECYACTNCICGLCGECVEAIMNGQSRGRMSMCPVCHGMDSNFKRFKLDLR